MTGGRRGGRLAALVDNILDAAAAKEGTFSVTLGSVNVYEVSDQVCKVMHSLVPKGVELCNGIDSTLPAIRADGERVNQILTNLVSNALKFTRKGRVTLSSRIQDGHMAVAVADTGIGIPTEMQTRVWEAFMQVDAETNRHYDGTGLGLALVKQMVESHGGRVELVSSQRPSDHGTTVTVFLPMQAPHASASPKDAFMSGVSPSPLRKRSHRPVPPSPLSKPLPLNVVATLHREREVPEEEAGTRVGVQDTLLRRTSSNSEKPIEILSVDDSWANQVSLPSSSLPAPLRSDLPAGRARALSRRETPRCLVVSEAGWRQLTLRCWGDWGRLWFRIPLFRSDTRYAGLQRILGGFDCVDWMLTALPPSLRYQVTTCMSADEVLKSFNERT